METNLKIQKDLRGLAGFKGEGDERLDLVDLCLERARELTEHVLSARLQVDPQTGRLTEEVRTALEQRFGVQLDPETNVVCGRQLNIIGVRDAAGVMVPLTELGFPPNVG